MAEQKEHKEPVFGIDESAMIDVETMSVSMDDLTEGGLADVDVTIIGFKSQSGGEQKESRDGGTFTTTDQLEVHQRIDNWEELGLEFQNTITYLPLPKLKQGPDGRMVRSKATKTSKYGIWLAAWESIGVSSSTEYASEVQIGGLADLIGLKFHRIKQAYPGFDGREVVVDIPKELYGYDNEVRAANNLPARALKSEKVPAAAGKK